MTISNTTTKQIFQGNGSTVTFAIPSSFTANSEVEVYLRDESVTPATETLQTEGGTYTVTGGDPGTNIQFTTAPASTDKVLIRRIVALTQSTDYLESAEFPAESHETALDKLTRAVQQLKEEVSRVISLRKTTALSNLEYPQPVANKVLAWNSSADALLNATVSDISGSTAILTASRAVVSDSGGAAEASSTTAAEIAAIGALSNSVAVVTNASGALVDATGVSAAELNFLSGVTSDIQSQIDDAAASGGGAFQVLPGSPAPLEIVTEGFLEYEFDPDTDQIINITFCVPSGFNNATKDIQIQFLHSTPATANVTRYVFDMELFTPGSDVRGTAGDTSQVVNAVTSDAVANEWQSITNKLSTTGSIGASGLAAGDFVLIRMRRDSDNAADTNTSVSRMARDSLVVKVVDQ